jgi:hypothetical protein
MKLIRPLLVSLVTMLLWSFGGASPSLADDKEAADFKALECNKCHAMARFEITPTIKSEKMHGPDLGEIGSERDAEWIQKWLLKEVELEGKTHKSKWDGTPKQLEAIATWLANLKKP